MVATDLVDEAGQGGDRAEFVECSWECVGDAENVAHGDEPAGFDHAAEGIEERCKPADGKGCTNAQTGVVGLVGQGDRATVGFDDVDALVDAGALGTQAGDFVEPGIDFDRSNPRPGAFGDAYVEPAAAAADVEDVLIGVESHEVNQAIELLRRAGVRDIVGGLDDGPKTREMHGVALSCGLGLGGKVGFDGCQRVAHLLLERCQGARVIKDDIGLRYFVGLG